MKPRTDRFLMIAAAVLGLLGVSWSSSPSGVIELSQPQQTPIVISQPGSYQLVSNLTATNPELDVVDIDTDNVTIDLNGFTIFHGLHARAIAQSPPSAPHSNIVIQNGSVTEAFGGMFGGILVGGNSTVRDVNLVGHGADVACGDNCIVDHVLVTTSPIGSDMFPTTCGSGCQIHSVTIAFLSGVTRPVLALTCQEGCLLTDSVFRLGNVTLGNSSSYALNNFSGGAAVAGGVNAGQNVCNGALCP